MNSKTIISLDVARGVAAILVFMSHVRAYLFLDYSKLPQSSKGIFTKVFYFVTSLGHESVMVFFVLSGFLVAGSVYKSFQNERFSWRLYMINRLTRLYIVFIPAIFLTLFWDKIGMFLTNSPYYDGALGHILPVGPKQPVNHSLSVFFQNLLFLQTITSPVFGTNGVVWSLANEFWYYVIFPITMILTISLSNRKTFRIICSVLLLLFFLIYFPTQIVFGFGVWMLGFGAFLIAKKDALILSLNVRSVRVISLCILAVCIFFSARTTTSTWFKDYVVGIGYTIVLLSFLNLSIKESITRRVVQFFSDLSYTLYLVHVPILAFTITYLFNNIRFDFDIKSFSIFIGYIVGLILYSYFIYALFEKRTPLVRNWILNRIKINK